MTEIAETVVMVASSSCILKGQAKEGKLLSRTIMKAATTLEVNP